MAEADYTSPEEFPQIVQSLRTTFKSGKTKDVAFRKQQLQRLIDMYEENRELLIESLQKDLGKPPLEANCNEIDPVITSLKKAIKNLDTWVKPQKKQKGLITLLDEVYTVPEPYGVVLIIGPWNYPSFCLFMPIIGAIAAGNCVLIKPSECVKSTSLAILKLVPQYLDKDCYRVICGGPKETSLLLQNRLDYILFTGGKFGGQKVYEAAARHLTPVTLELGGKSPVYIDDNISDLRTTVKRILWGKCVNSGQTCVAPDYVLCSDVVKDKLVCYAKDILREFYGNNNNNSKDYGRIVNDHHFRRLESLLKSSKGTVAIGGEMDAVSRYFAPTVVVDVKLDDALMQDEIFGPILPVVTVGSSSDAIRIINNFEKPLALYVFSENRDVIEAFKEDTSSGSLVVNETVIQCGVSDLPFGGVGSSGFGSYFGRTSFDTFSHHKPILVHDFNSVAEAIASIRYPPYSDYNRELLSSLLVTGNAYVPERILHALTGVAFILFAHFVTFCKRVVGLE